MKVPIYHSYDKWHLSGVNTWTVNLIRAMGDTEFDSRVLFTGIPRSPQPELDELAIAYDFLGVPCPRKRHQEWRVLKEFLEAQTPCIYIPNYDFHRSCAVGTLSNTVKVCAVIHSDEPCYFDEIGRLGKNFDAIVAVSEFLGSKIQQEFPRLDGLVTHIPHGIQIPEQRTEQRPVGGVLRLAYCNRLQQYQKRVFDLPPITAQLKQCGVPFELTIAGEGPDEAELRQRFIDVETSDAVTFLGRIPNSEVLEVFRDSHIFLLTSDFEGLPISLLEAMSVGCVPVAYQTPSGIGEAIEHRQSGMMVRHGDITALVKVLGDLSQDRKQLFALGERSADRIQAKFNIDRMCGDYAVLFRKLLQQSESGAQPNRTGRIHLPPDLTLRSRARKWALRRFGAARASISQGIRESVRR